jgi:hypothetical protein
MFYIVPILAGDINFVSHDQNKWRYVIISCLPCLVYIAS